jgi:hypothetical protein
MAANWRARLVVGALALAALAGCNPIVSLEYIFNNGDPQTKPEFALTQPASRKHEDIRVVVITSARPSLGESVGMDQALAVAFTQALEKFATDSKVKLTVLKHQPLARYRDDHPEWKSDHPIDIGKHFGADYAIDMEILSLSLYEPGSARRLLRGRGSIALQVYDLSKRDRTAAMEQEYPILYPNGYEVDAGDQPLSAFRSKLIKRVAEDLAMKFVPRSTGQHPMDN